ncbi:MAG: hypothetical protein M1835_001327 [Candelina submexicana]|nr:MAG: hypothetical protein M1835_001327 [Candelina submexicana]
MSKTAGASHKRSEVCLQVRAEQKTFHWLEDDKWTRKARNAEQLNTTEQRTTMFTGFAEYWMEMN